MSDGNQEKYLEKMMDNQKSQKDEDELEIFSQMMDKRDYSVNSEPPQQPQRQLPSFVQQQQQQKKQQGPIIPNNLSKNQKKKLKEKQKKAVLKNYEKEPLIQEEPIEEPIDIGQIKQRIQDGKAVDEDDGLDNIQSLDQLHKIQQMHQGGGYDDYYEDDVQRRGGQQPSGKQGEYCHDHQNQRQQQEGQEGEGEGESEQEEEFYSVFQVMNPFALGLNVIINLFAIYIWWHYNVLTIVYEDDGMTEKDHVVYSIFTFKSTWAMLVLYALYMYECFYNGIALELKKVLPTEQVIKYIKDMKKEDVIFEYQVRAYHYYQHKHEQLGEQKQVVCTYQSNEAFPILTCNDQTPDVALFVQQRMNFFSMQTILHWYFTDLSSQIKYEKFKEQIERIAQCRDTYVKAEQNIHLQKMKENITAVGGQNSFWDFTSYYAYLGFSAIGLSQYYRYYLSHKIKYVKYRVEKQVQA